MILNLLKCYCPQQWGRVLQARLVAFAGVGKRLGSAPVVLARPKPTTKSPGAGKGRGLSSGSCRHVSLPCLSPQVEVEVESMDKVGNFIGWLHIEGVNLSVALVEQALSKVHFTAERSNYYKPLLAAEEAAKQKKEKVQGLLRALLGGSRAFCSWLLLQNAQVKVS